MAVKVVRKQKGSWELPWEESLLSGLESGKGTSLVSNKTGATYQVLGYSKEEGYLTLKNESGTAFNAVVNDLVKNRYEVVISN